MDKSIFYVLGLTPHSATHHLAFVLGIADSLSCAMSFAQYLRKEYGWKVVEIKQKLDLPLFLNN